MHREIFGSGLRGGGGGGGGSRSGGGADFGVGSRLKSSILMAGMSFVIAAAAMLAVLASGEKAIAQDGGAALATKSLQEENSRLIAAIERLNQRIDALESKLTRAAAGQSSQSTSSPAGQPAGQNASQPGGGPNVAVSANPNPGKIHGLAVDPDGVNYEGGTWLHHPQTGQVVFAENIFQRRQGGGGSLVIELIRKNGKPVPLPSVTYGDLTVAQPPGNGGGGGGSRGGRGSGGGGSGRGPRALIEFPGDDVSGE